MSVAVVTGASSGIGAAIAIAFAENGWDVMAAGRDEERLAEVADASENIVTWEGDLETSEDCESGYCVSAYDAGTNPPVGPSVCVAECVEAGALDRACTDDASCCGELICSAQALCVEVEPDTTGTGGTDTGN